MRKVQNIVAQAVQQCGGPIRAAEIMGVGRTTVWRWCQQGRISKLSAAGKLAKAVNWPLEKLAV